MGFDFELVNSLFHLSNFDSDCGLFLLASGKLSGFGLNVALIGFNGSFKTSNLIINLGLLGLILDGALSLLKISDLLLFLGDLSSIGLDVMLMLSSSLSMSVTLSLEILLLSMDNLLGLLSGVSVSESLLLVVVCTTLVRMSVVSATSSVGRSSLSFLLLFLSVQSFSLHSSVRGVIGCIGSSDCGNFGGVGSNVSGILSDVFGVSLNVSLDGRDFLLDSFLLRISGSTKSGLSLRQSLFKITYFRLVAGKLLFLFIKLFGQG